MLSAITEKEQEFFRAVQRVEAKNFLIRFAVGFQQLVEDVYGQCITLDKAATYASQIIKDYGMPGFDIDNFPNCYFPLEDGKKVR